MNCVRQPANWVVRWGLLGLVSGVLSCVVSQSHLLVHDQKTLDHIVWPGLVFALVVLLPLSRWAGDGWLRAAASLIASSAVYPICWWITASIPRQLGAYMVGAFGFSGFLGALVLGSVFLFGRPGWVRAACKTVLFGTVIGGLMGAALLAAGSSQSARAGLGVFMVMWQTVVAASLGRGIPARRNHATVPNGGPAAPQSDSGASGDCHR